MQINSKPFGILPDGREVRIFTLDNDHGVQVDIINFGGTVTAIRIPDKNKVPGDVVLGFDTLEKYTGDHPYFGGIIGRYANRIAKGIFKLDGKIYKLVKNNGNNHLHGGIKGFNKVLWTAATEKTIDSVSLKLGYMSSDMEEGYPGNLMTEVVYALNEANELIISYRASSDKATHVNLTNHSYFNLNNCDGDILDHELMIDADRMTEFNNESIPTGKIISVKDSCFDFRMGKTIGRYIDETEKGYDHNYVINGYDGELQRIATIYHPGSGRSMDVLSTQPGLQFYTSNYIDNIQGKQGKVYKKHAALCLETQHFPDSPNQQSFPSTVLIPGEEYHQVTIYRFNWK